MVFFITVPATVGLIILGIPIIRVLLERGAFDTTSTLMTNRALIFYALGLLAFSGIRVMVSAFYALQDTKTPVKIAIIAFLTNLAFSLILMGPLKHGGLALALSIASSLQFCLLVIFLKRKVPVVNLRPVMISALKCAFAAVVMGSGVFYVYSRWLTADSGSGLWHMSTDLAGLIGIGVVLYFVLARILRCRELESLWEIFFPIARRVKAAQK
jgi:putative peptidoglycan lipid II flippase